MAIVKTAISLFTRTAFSYLYPPKDCKLFYYMISRLCSMCTVQLKTDLSVSFMYSRHVGICNRSTKIIKNHNSVICM